MEKNSSYKTSKFGLLMKFPAFWKIKSFITVFAGARHVSPFSSISTQSTQSQPISVRPILISSYLSLGFPSGFFPSGYPIKTLCTPPLSPIHATYPVQLVLLDLINWELFGEDFLNSVFEIKGEK